MAVIEFPDPSYLYLVISGLRKLVRNPHIPLDFNIQFVREQYHQGKDIADVILALEGLYSAEPELQAIAGTP